MTALSRTIRTKGVPRPVAMTRATLPPPVVAAAAVAAAALPLPLPLPLVLVLPTAMDPMTFSRARRAGIAHGPQGVLLPPAHVASSRSGREQSWNGRRSLVGKLFLRPPRCFHRGSRQEGCRRWALQLAAPLATRARARATSAAAVAATRATLAARRPATAVCERCTLHLIRQGLYTEGEVAGFI